ncbi:MAG: S28 family serine protease [Psychroserpens sp.]|uniref:S28 family serine protease n=1 Tax=Psychroserpens sp. TaxID=2020870 RepID=UPI003C763E67
MTVKHIFLMVLMTVSIFSCNSTKTVVTEIPKQSISNFDKLSSIPQVISVEKLMPSSHFDHYYELQFNQPVDHDDLSKGSFNQRVLLGLEDISLPVIVELKGYGIGSRAAGELSKHYNTNELVIEHRYFNRSRPNTIDWNTLTIENAAKDQTIIINAIRNALFPEAKFITTGISKGCQTTMAHRRFFPKDVDASVCYVGPLNYQREDPRVYSHLKTVATKAERDAVKDFQNLCFEHKTALLQKFKDAANSKNMTWEIGAEKALEYTILEYSFVFWQYGSSVASIPEKDASVTQIYAHLIDVVGYGFFEEQSVNNLQPYFWAALTQQGIYGYETAPFKSYLNTEEIYKFDWAFPEGVTKDYDLKPMQEIKQFLDTKAENMIFIYGEYDAWSATAVELNDTSQEREVYKFVQPKGDHSTRIRSFSKTTQAKIYSIIDSWIEN